MVEAIKKTETEVDKRRVLVFLEDVAGRTRTFTLADPIDGMILVAPSRPADIGENIGTERRIEIEMIEAIESLKPDDSAQVRTMAQRWSAKTEALKRALSETKGSEP